MRTHTLAAVVVLGSLLGGCTEMAKGFCNFGPGDFISAGLCVVSLPGALIETAADSSDPPHLQGARTRPRPPPPTIEELEAEARDCDRFSQYQLVLRLQNSEPERALYWLRRSAHGGHGFARYTYANIYRDGSDLVEPDNVRAYLWYSLALSAYGIDSDSFDIAGKRDDLALQMTEAEIAEAERLIAGWEPTPCKAETA